MKKRHLPLILFLVLVVFLGIGLTRDPRVVPSPLIGKAAPAFTAPQLLAADQSFSAKEMLGKVWLLNVWASLCVACQQEHPIWVDFAKTKQVPLIGLNYKDQPVDGIKWLERYGDPYDLSVIDRDGRIGIDFGVYGVPETFLIDQKGMIRHKQIGPVTVETLTNTLLPLIKELQQ
jgi:cytochrome c biogenesis protein CcmG, thiol:disulfide interchange protein DsbE